MLVIVIMYKIYTGFALSFNRPFNKAKNYKNSIIFILGNHNTF